MPDAVSAIWSYLGLNVDDISSSEDHPQIFRTFPPSPFDASPGSSRIAKVLASDLSYNNVLMGVFVESVDSTACSCGHVLLSRHPSAAEPEPAQ